jgi:hypothetical protein
MCDPKMGFLSVASASTAKDDSAGIGLEPSGFQAPPKQGKQLHMDMNWITRISIIARCAHHLVRLDLSVFQRLAIANLAAKRPVDFLSEDRFQR